MKLTYDMLGAEYLYTKAAVIKAQSYEDDLRALLAQYTGDEATLELFRATKLARFIPTDMKVVEPSIIEKAAFKYYVGVLEAIRGRTPGIAFKIYEAYRAAIIARDIELIIRMKNVEGKIAGAEELIYPEAEEVARARRLAEEDVDPARILSAAGMNKAAEIIKKSRSIDLLSAAIDIEILNFFNEAKKVAKTDTGRDILGARQDMFAARTAVTLATIQLDREVLAMHEAVLETHRLPKRKLLEAIETRDVETLERILIGATGGKIAEGLTALDTFISSIRKENRKRAKSIFVREILSLDVIAGLLELLLLDAEDAIIIALSGYSKQPKSIVAELVSF
ncbi:Archaeal/vacuolar-type H+-ATPase subunit C [Pyrodictium delaneyi]|uniref:Archaeal/vacuolar-type H+-ATPase subunit C n=1 Tax=Pyrodictium delaneyi TaxID=1273541 RepID=A0A0P0N4G8_9CREN|nr:hypothetical protein [Pyrodictium delaneyi]ALL01318.1 Archaeal/vacuolar-type H+-ATPase subunit C [Pyrodictium delaneyi]OWJ53866.1 hypothetical protein Pdsh_10140 [Pyrodictium delaneyi]